MLEKHHTDGSALTSKALLLEEREEQVLLFAVVTSVGKELEEFQQAIERLWLDWFAPPQPPGDLFTCSKHF
jgi:hypothetical protein